MARLRELTSKSEGKIHKIHYQTFLPFIKVGVKNPILSDFSAINILLILSLKNKQHPHFNGPDYQSRATVSGVSTGLPKASNNHQCQGMSLMQVMWNLIKKRLNSRYFITDDLNGSKTEIISFFSLL